MVSVVIVCSQLAVTCPMGLSEMLGALSLTLAHVSKLTWSGCSGK